MLAPRLRCSFESGFELINGDTSTIPEAEAVEIRSLITDAPGSYLGKVLGTVHISATKNTPLEERIMFKDTWCASPSGRHLLPPVLLLQDLLLGPTCILLLLQDLLLGPTCILPVHCLYTTCTIHAHYMYNACTLHVQCMHTAMPLLHDHQGGDPPMSCRTSYARAEVVLPCHLSYRAA